MKKILFIVNNLIVGGVEKVCWEIISNLPSSEYHIDLLVAVDEDIAQYYDDKFTGLGCQVYKGGSICDNYTKRKFLHYENSLLKRNHYDVVHSHVDFLNIWTLRCAKHSRVYNRISHVHTTFPDKKEWTISKKVKYMIQKLLLSYYSTTRLACSAMAVKDYYGHAKAMVLYNAFNINEYLRINNKKKDDKLLVTVGRICDQKNPDFILDVFCFLLQKDNKYEMYWIGDGILRNHIERRIKELGLQNSVHMIGSTIEIKPYLEQCRTALFPSKVEGLGIALIEAQLAHCFTFYSDVIPDEENIGYALPLSLNAPPQEWADVIHSFIRSQSYIGYENDEFLIQKYSIKNMVSKISCIYNN